MALITTVLACVAWRLAIFERAKTSGDRQATQATTVHNVARVQSTVGKNGKFYSYSKRISLKGTLLFWPLFS